MTRTATLTVSLALALCVSGRASEVVLTTASWANNDAAFAKFDERIERTHGRNLLARRKVRIVAASGVSMAGVRALADGEAGERGQEGRVAVSGQPSEITYYLGEPKPVEEVGVYTFNIDARANQDYEVRFFNNSQHPGVKPAFRAEPDFTTGSKVIGADRGGFHSAFRPKDGGEIVPGKADWVQFRIWRTYNVKAGSPAKANNTAQSWTALIELEVLGDEKDSIVLSPQELARRKAIRKAPRKPSYEKKATWQETMVAAREAIVEWECLQDRLAMPDSGAVFGPWHTLGPLAGDSKLVAEIERQNKIDLGRAYPGSEGKTLGWRAAPELGDGELVDLAQRSGAKAGDTVFLCRSVVVEQQFDWRNPYLVSVGLRSGWVRLLPRRWTSWPSKPPRDPYPNQGLWQWRIDPGEYQVLAKLPCADEGKSALWFLPMSSTLRPGGGSYRSRVSRRESLYWQLRRDFPDPVSAAQIEWEQLDSIWLKFERRSMARIEKFVSDWPPGDPDFLCDQYAAQLTTRAAAARAALAEFSDAERTPVLAWLAEVEAGATKRDTATQRRAYYGVATMQEALGELRRVESMRLAVEDQRQTFRERYPKAGEYLARVAALQRQADAALARVLSSGDAALADVLDLRKARDRAGQDVLMANPLLDFGKLLVLRGGCWFASNWSGPNRMGNEIAVLSPVRPDGSFTTIHKGNVSSMELSFDAKRIIFSDGKRIHEVGVDGSGLRQVSSDEPDVMHYDPCYLPNGKIVFVSTACEQAVPCTGQAYVGNLHVMDPDGGNERRLTFDQDHNWNPVVMQDGRVLFTRWEYNDTPHYFSRLLFQMYPDGTNQMEYYGSNSYWPNAFYWPRPIPGHPSMVACIISGHHGVAREGELVLLDPALGRHEADGVVQRIPGRGKRVEPVIEDGLVSDSWPRFAAPWPLAERQTHLGAGKYFLVNARLSPIAPWGLYLVDVFDNMTPLLMGNYFMPFPVEPRARPPVIQDRVNLGKSSATVYMSNVYQGDGLKGYPRGSIKALRVASLHYRFTGNGDTRASSYEGGWDVKRILGTVPVHEDGSALFTVPANVPIFVQPLDAEGKAQQQMRSWYTAMPGERFSCVGCHEPQNAMPPNAAATATRQPASAIKPWHGPTRGFSFDREVQPVLDRRCAGCHNGQPRKDGTTLPDLRAKRLHKDYNGPYSPAYLALHPYVRRVGYEADYHMLAPAEFEADTSQLVQMLKKGHHNVTLSREDWDRLYTWIDLNIPYPLNWRESHRPPRDDQVARRVKYKKLHADIDDRDEEPLPLPAIAKFEPPAQTTRNPEPAIHNPDGWPFDAQEAARRQQACGLARLALDLGNGVKMGLVPIPAGAFVMGDANGFPDERPVTVVSIHRPFYMGEFEVTNAQFVQFNPSHDSGYMEGRFKDRYTRGTPVNTPEQPVIRVSWNQAIAFCEWLSKKTGRRCTLPTEAQWEYACRAGTATSFSFGEKKAGLRDVGNFSDATLRGWNWGRVEPDYSDGASFSIAGGRYKPNAWGLHDMHGNVAEWCLSAYKPYPHDPRDAALGFRVLRGGSWNDTLRYSRSAHRWRYRAYQPVYNVGFRVVCLPAGHAAQGH